MSQGACGVAFPQVSILIVAYNSAGYISDCIGSIIKHTRAGSYEILLIDNGKDGTERLVREAFPEVRVIASQGNIGFGRGNNLLAEHARGRFLLLLNPDTCLIDPAIDELLEFAKCTPAGAWGGLTMYPDGSLDPGNFLTIPTLGSVVREAFGGGKSEKRKTELEALQTAQRTAVLCGGFMMISRAVWDQIGGFDPSFLLYAEEIDLFTRLAKAGHQSWLTPTSKIVHDVGSGNPNSAMRMRFLFSGQMHYARRHWSTLGAQVAGWAYWFKAARRWLASAAAGMVSSEQRARRAAYGAIVFRPSIWWRGYEGRTSLD